MAQPTNGNDLNPAKQRWYYAREKQRKRGPVGTAELKSLAHTGRLVGSDMVLREGTTQWVPAGSVKGLFSPPTPQRCTAIRPHFCGGPRPTHVAGTAGRWWAALTAVAAGALLAILGLSLLPEQAGRTEPRAEAADSDLDPIALVELNDPYAGIPDDSFPPVETGAVVPEAEDDAQPRMTFPSRWSPERLPPAVPPPEIPSAADRPAVSEQFPLTEEKFESGKVRRRFGVKDGKKEGPFVEFYPDGQVKVQATYRADLLDGRYLAYHRSGQPQASAVFRKGRLDGALYQYDETGKAYLCLGFRSGVPIYPRSQWRLRDGLARLRSAPPPQLADAVTAERHAALQRLKCYRLVVGVPYEYLELDERYNELALAGARLCEKIGRLDHTPKNPGLPDEEYRLGYAGTSQSNLCAGSDNLPATVDCYMDDSDPGNIAAVGHRRWCLNPHMGKTGFGRSGAFSAMYAFDHSRQTLPDFDFIAYPAEGWMPVEYFGPRHAWSVSLNPRKFLVPGEAVKPHVYELDERYRKRGELALDYCTVSDASVGGMPCLIFRPERLAISPGKRFLVEIDGLLRPDGTAAPVSYVVEFFRAR